MPGKPPLATMGTMTDSPAAPDASATPARARRAYHHGGLAEALVAAARAEIERVGPASLSLSECCRSAGVSTAAPYKHFRGKDDLLRHVIMAGFGDLGAALTAARDARPGPPAPRIAAMGRAYVRFALEQPGLFHLMFGKTAEHHAADEAEMEAAGLACFGVLIEEVAGGIGERADGDAARGLSVMLWTFVHGAASLALEGAYEAAHVEPDVDGMIEAATRRLLPDLA